MVATADVRETVDGVKPRSAEGILEGSAPNAETAVGVETNAVPAPTATGGSVLFFVELEDTSLGVALVRASWEVG